MVIALDFSIFQSETVFIPFLFVLAIVFGSLNVVNVFKNKGVNFLISLALAFFTISNPAFVNLLWSNFGIISLLFITLFFIIFITRAFGLHMNKEGDDPMIINTVILFILLSLSYLHTDLLSSFPFIGDEKNFLLLIFITLMLVIFWFAYKTKTPPVEIRQHR